MVKHSFQYEWQYTRCECVRFISAIVLIALVLVGHEYDASILG